MAHPTPLPTKSEKYNPESLKRMTPRLLGLFKSEGNLLLLGTIALLGGAGLNLTFPYIIKNKLNFGLALRELNNSLTSLTLLLLLLFIIQGFCFYYRHYFIQLLGLKITKDLKDKLFTSLIREDISFFDSNRLGDILSRISTDTEAIQKGLSVNISVIVRYLIQVIGGIALMLYISPFLTALIVLLIPLLALASMIWSKKLRALSRQLQESLGSLNIRAEEALTGIRIVKIHSAESFEEDAFKKENLESLSIADQRTKIAAMFSSSMVTLLHCSIVIIMWIGVKSVVNGDLLPGDLTAFLLYCTIVAVSFGFLINAWAEFLTAVGAADRIYEIIDRKTETLDSNKKNKSYFDTSLAPEIEFSGVSFTYPSRGSQKILDNISIKISSGFKVAIVGPSGAGKSTLVSLLPRLYDPLEGVIKINNIDIKEYSLEDLRNNIAFVPQQAQLFSGTLLENITYGLKNPNPDLVKYALDLSALRSTIETMPNGLNTLVGDKGIRLSGGEKQRISIARAIIRDPKLLIFDEATSSLDSENEQIIKNSLEKVSKGRTTLIIAHRLSTVKDVDLVIVLKDGKVNQVGTHSELMKADGLYKNLVNFQFIEN